MNVFAAAILSLFLAASASAQTITIARPGTRQSTLMKHGRETKGTTT